MTLLYVIEIHPGTAVTVALFAVSLVLGLADAARPTRARGGR